MTLACSLGWIGWVAIGVGPTLGFLAAALFAVGGSE